MSADEDGSDSIRRDAVGYGRPPKHSQFAKGKSGNPKGRPKSPASSRSGDPLLDELFLAEGKKKIPVREGDIVKSITKIEAIVKSSFNAAMKGDVRAQMLVMTRMDLAKEAEAAEITRLNELYARYQKVTRVELAEAAKRGVPPTVFLPHPDDIVIDPETGPRILGPMDEDQVAELEHNLRLRKVLILQDALDARSTTRLNGQPLNEPGTAVALAHHVNSCIPPRLRWSDDDMIIEMVRCQALTKRELLKRLHQSWRSLGTPLPRGYVSPNLNVVVRDIKFIADILKALNTEAIDSDDLINGNYSDTTRAICDKHGYELPG